MSTDMLEIIKEVHSQGDNYSEDGAVIDEKDYDQDNVSLRMARLECLCHTGPMDQKHQPKPEENNIEELLMKKEMEVKAHYEELMKEEIAKLNDKIDLVLQTEQTRTAYMMTEAHRDRHEKIAALQRQLQNKNLSGLMYVLCAERRKSKLEKIRIISDFSSYITQLKAILKEGQSVILDLAKGYKSAARVDQEWREKMKRILKEFKCFIRNYAGGTPEQNEYLLDVPALLATSSPLDSAGELLDSDPEEEEEEEPEEEPQPSADQKWWEQLSAPGHQAPFVVYGDMSEFRAPQRREVLRAVKGAKTAPKNWREYVFDDARVRRGCSKLALAAAEAPRRPPAWAPPNGNGSVLSTKSEATGRSYTMGSMLKIFAASNTFCEPVTKAILLAARDSNEIASSTKLLNKMKPTPENVGVAESVPAANESAPHDAAAASAEVELNTIEDEAIDDINAVDSLTLQPKTMSNHSNMIVYEKVDSFVRSLPAYMHQSPLTHLPPQYCPVEQCRRLQVDSFVRSLPAYMHQSPLTHLPPQYCPVEQCRRLQVDSFVRSLPAYMHQSPLTHLPPQYCPVEQCRRLQVDSFVRSLPAYMHQSPLTHLPPQYCPVEQCRRLQVDSFVRSLPAYMHQSPLTHLPPQYCPVEQCRRLQVDSFVRSLPAYMHQSPLTHLPPQYCPVEQCRRLQVDSFVRSLPAYMHQSPLTHLPPQYCPVEQCRRLQVDSFVRSLPAYMHQSPLIHFDHYFEEYECCSPEQIEVLKQRILEKKARLKQAPPAEEHPLLEWQTRAAGAATQTEPYAEPCPCHVSEAPSYADVIDVKGLLPTKLLIDHVTQQHLYSERVQLDRCSVVGHEDLCRGHGLNLQQSADVDPETFRRSRMAEIADILRRHPSLADLFQSNTTC